MKWKKLQYDDVQRISTTLEQFELNLFSINNGITPPCFDRIEVDAEHNNLVDHDGNAIGGLRTPFIDCPACRYVPYSDYNGGKFTLFGHIVPFTTSQLQEKYGSLLHYKELVEKSTEDAIAEGRLLEADNDNIIRMALGSASNRGLS